MTDSLLMWSVRNAIGLQRYANGLADRIIAELNEEAFAPALSRIRSRLNMRARFGFVGPDPQLEREIQDLVKEAFKRVYFVLADQLEGLFLTQTQTLAKALAIRLPPVVRGQIRALGKEFAREIVRSRPFEGKVLREHWQTISRSAQRGITRALRQGMLEGKSTKSLVRAIRGTKENGYADGFLRTSRRHAEGLARTWVTHTSGNADLEMFRKNRDVIEGWRFVATLDSRTTIICASRDGQVYSLDSSRHLPPLHWNCRSKIVASLFDDVPDFQRASVKGPVRGDMDYEQFMREQDKAFQDDVLGPERAALWRSGKVPLSKFVNDRNRVLTLEELSKWL